MKSFDLADRRILPLFETLEQVICALGSELVQPFIQEIYSRAV
jgi:hypothetical protein